MNEQGVCEDESKTEPTEFALLMVGVRFAASPHLLKKKVTGEETETGPSDNPRFTRFMYDISSRFRAPLDLRLERMSDEDEPAPDTGEEVVLVRYALHNMQRGLRMGVSSGSASVLGLSPVLSLDTSEKHFIRHLIEELSRYAFSELSVSLQNLGKEAGLRPGDMAIYNGTSVLFVRDLQHVEGQMKECKKGEFSNHRRFLVMTSGVPITLADSKRWAGQWDLRSVVYIVEDPEVITWAKNGGPLPEYIDEVAESIELAEQRLSSVLATQILLLTAAWIRRECIDALNEMSRGLAEQAALEHILKLTERVGGIRAAHLQLVDLLSFRNDRVFSPERHCLLGVGEPMMTFTECKAFVKEIEGELTMIEGAIRDRLTLQSIETERARQELESRSQAKFNAFSIILGALVLFEILAEYYSWQFSVDDPIAQVLWSVSILGVLVIVGLVLWGLNKVGNHITCL